METVQCPFCHRINRVGLAQPLETGSPIPMIDICEHHVFTIFTAAPWDYLAYALHREVHQLPGVGRHEAELDAILRRHFTIIEPAAFAISQDARDRAKREITRFLTERNFRL